MSNIRAASGQTVKIGAAINGNSSGMQVLGNVGTDPRPEVMLAVGLAHAQNALAAVIEELEALRAEVDALKSSRR